MRAERPALNRGTIRGGKPADQGRLRGANCSRRTSPVPYADARNLCLKRRERKVAQWLRRHDQNGMMVAAPLNPRCRLLPSTIRRIAGSYGALFHTSDWKKGTPQPLDLQGVRKC
jgi:hypothetical protein